MVPFGGVEGNLPKFENLVPVGKLVFWWAKELKYKGIMSLYNVKLPEKSDSGIIFCIRLLKIVQNWQFLRK